MMSNSASTQTAIGTRTAIGVDIGGTKINAAPIFENSHEVQDLLNTPTPKEGEAFLSAIVTMVRKLSDTREVAAVGISTAGIVNVAEGKITGATGNLPAVRSIPCIREALQERLNLPVYVENDANAAAYGEYKVGAAKGANNVLMITLGTGVGTGLVIDGKILHGRTYSAGEGGHVFVSMNKDRLCTCGKWDCWEAYASGTGLAETTRRILKAAPNGEHSSMRTAPGGGLKAIDEVNTYDLIRARDEGDPVALEVMDTWHMHISVGLASAINLLDPDVVVVGGGLMQFVDFDKLTALTQARSMASGIKLVPAVLGNNAGILGAACLALQHLDGGHG